MNENRTSRGPSWGLVLLIPAALIIAKGAMRRRAMWESAWGTSGSVGHAYGHHGHFAGGEDEPDRRTAFRLPPKIERTLDAWHARAHQATDADEPPAA